MNARRYPVQFAKSLGLALLFCGATAFAESTPAAPQERGSDFELGSLAMTFMQKVQKDAALRDACAADLAACFETAGKSIPAGSDMHYSYSENDGHLLTYKDSLGATQSVRVDAAGTLAMSSEGGFEARAGCPYAAQMFVKCWDPYGGFPNNCMNSNSCYCKDPANQQVWPCNYSTCQAVGGECNSGF